MTEDALHCSDIVRRCARTFGAAGRYLPADKRRAMHAVYAFCRVADDLVDLPREAGARAVAAELDALEVGLTSALAGAPRGPVLRELAWAAQRFGIPAAPLHELVAAVRADITPHPFARWADLRHYCAGVASTVGEVCAHVFGLPAEEPARAIALGHARTLGLAMQLTNILRDVGEDARLGRCYIPEEDLAAFGLDREEILNGTVAPADSRWRALATFQVGRARALYESAEPGIPLLAADAQRCARMCAVGYARILDALAAIGYDSITRRARVGAAVRLTTLARVWWATRRPLSPVGPFRTPGRARLPALARATS